jgi:hypothetical protein
MERRRRLSLLKLEGQVIQTPSLNGHYLQRKFRYEKYKMPTMPSFPLEVGASRDLGLRSED